MSNRIRWPAWLIAALVVALTASWHWRSSSDPAIAPAPLLVALSPAAVIARASAHETDPMPIPAATAKPVDVAPSVATFKLIGTVVAAHGADSFALVRRTADSRLLQWRAGDRVAGLTVSAIESGDVVLAGAGQALVIEADRSAAPMTSLAVSPAVVPDVEPAWAGDPAPFGH